MRFRESKSEPAPSNRHAIDFHQKGRVNEAHTNHLFICTVGPISAIGNEAQGFTDLHREQRHLPPTSQCAHPPLLLPVFGFRSDRRLSGHYPIFRVLSGLPVIHPEQRKPQRT